MIKKEKVDNCLILDYVHFIIDDWDVKPSQLSCYNIV